VQIIIRRIGFNWAIQAQIGDRVQPREGVQTEFHGCKEEATKE